MNLSLRIHSAPHPLSVVDPLASPFSERLEAPRRRMPLPLLFALILAFGFDSSDRPNTMLAPMPWREACQRAGEAALGILFVAAFAFTLGKIVSWRVARQGRATPLVRRAFALGVRASDLLSVLVFGWIIHELDWPRVVRSGFKLGDPPLLDDALILLPFLLAQFVGWWGVYQAERVLRPVFGSIGIRRHLLLKARMSLGIVLPVAAFYGLGTDLIHRAWPSTIGSPWEQPVSLAAMGLLVLTLAPLFVRIAWPTRTLPAGPLRDRLERVATRFGFRCTDILVWDTNQLIVNAAVTGSLPWFRYVLLTDAMVENLEPHEIAAVFGHEVGHIAHRHLAYFGFFLVASLGALAMATDGARLAIGRFLPVSLTLPAWVTGESTTAQVIQVSMFVILGGGYFLGVFGFISRRFERQADVYGCRVVSCGSDDCPPHADLDGCPGVAPGRSTIPLCPVGIRIFINSLANVAIENGMRPEAWSWRHGSITHRIAFLETLIGRPEAERDLQTGVKRLRRGLALVLLLTFVALAAATR